MKKDGAIMIKGYITESFHMVLIVKKLCAMSLWRDDHVKVTTTQPTSSGPKQYCSF